MKRILAALSFAVLAAPVYAVENGLPFEQTQFDRGISTQEQASAGASSIKDNVWADDYNFVSPAQ